MLALLVLEPLRFPLCWDMVVVVIAAMGPVTTGLVGQAVLAAAEGADAAMPVL